MIAIGGGGGRNYYSQAQDGGSGGGGSLYSNPGGSGTPGQGHNGGTGYNDGGYTPAFGGGGGGAGSEGLSFCGAFCDGQGGDGLTYSISGTPTAYGAGGGGTYMAGRPATVGAPGGSDNVGGQGGVVGGYTIRGGDALQNTGSGGGGGNLCIGGEPGSSYLNGCIQNGVVGPYESGHGANGIVIIAYPTGAVTASGGAETTSGTNSIHTFRYINENPTLELTYYGPWASESIPSCTSYLTDFDIWGGWQAFGETGLESGVFNVVATDGSTAVYDLQAILGAGNVLQDTFLIRYTFNFTNSPDGNFNGSLMFSMQSGVDHTDLKDYRNSDKHSGYYGYSVVAHRHNSGLHESWLNELNPGHPYSEEVGIDPLTAGTHYIELMKEDTTLRYRRYFDGTYTAVIEEFNKPVAATLDEGIRYLVLYGRWNGNLEGNFDDIALYDGSNTASCEP